MDVLVVQPVIQAVLAAATGSVVSVSTTVAAVASGQSLASWTRG